MGNCCTNEENRVISEYKESHYKIEERDKMSLNYINYGPLKRDEDEGDQNMPNIIAFGQPVTVLDENEQEIAQDNMFQLLVQSGISQTRDPLEKSFRAVILSPERTNRMRVLNQVENSHFLNEPLSDNQKDTRCMELNKNIKTPTLTNSFYRGEFLLNMQERPFYNNSINKNVQQSTMSQSNTQFRNSAVGSSQQPAIPIITSLNFR